MNPGALVSNGTDSGIEMNVLFLYLLSRLGIDTGFPTRQV